MPRAVGEHLGALAGVDLAARVRMGNLPAANTRRAERKKALTAQSSSRWAGAVTRTSEDQYQLCRRALNARIGSLRRAIGALEAGLAVPPGTSVRRGHRTVRGYAGHAERRAKQQRLQILKADLRQAEREWKHGGVRVTRGGRQRRIATSGIPAEVTASQPSRNSLELPDGYLLGDLPPLASLSVTGHARPPVHVMPGDDAHLIRGALTALLGLEDDLVVVAEAATGPEAMARAHEPDVAVLDLQMPGADGVRVATSLRAELPGCQVLIVTSHGRPGHLERALAAGVRGFVPKTVSAQRLAGIIRTVHAGNRYVDPELAADAISAGDSPLTVREAEVLEFAADGAPVAEIAERAALSQGTVRNYLSSAATKLGAENRHAAVRLARERGWV